MHVDPILLTVVSIALVVLLLGLVLRTLNQPHLIAYLISGMAIGPSGLAIVDDINTITHLGSIGVIMLLFFIGMEVSPGRLARNWKIAIIGTSMQVLISVLSVGAVGYWLEWPISRVILLGFVISLSSTAVVLKLLQDRGELDTPAGQNVLVILLTQDLAIVPMIIVLGLLAGGGLDIRTFSTQSLGGLAILSFAVWVIRKRMSAFRSPARYEWITSCRSLRHW